VTRDTTRRVRWRSTSRRAFARNEVPVESDRAQRLDHPWGFPKGGSGWHVVLSLERCDAATGLGTGPHNPNVLDNTGCRRSRRQLAFASSGRAGGIENRAGTLT